MTQREELSDDQEKLNWLLGLEKETLADMAHQQSKIIEKLQKAAKATLFTIPDRMDYEFHGDTVISNPFVDGYNQALSDVISMNDEYANSTGSDGWKLVPVEPTPEMMLHGSDCQHHAWNDKECPMRNSRRSIWKHMCEAAPELNKAGAQ